MPVRYDKILKMSTGYPAVISQNAAQLNAVVVDTIENVAKKPDNNADN